MQPSLPAGRLETLCEEYGQYAIYKGTITGHPNAYSLVGLYKCTS